MDYSPEQFFNLVGAVETQGGVLTEELCKSREYTLTGPKGKPIILPGCGNVSIFEIPYVDEPHEDDGPVIDRPTIQLCAVCDNIGGQPRFAHVMGGEF